MLFHLTYTIAPEHRDVAQSRFSDTGGPPPEGVKMIGRWHSAGGRKGFIIAEAAEAKSLAAWVQMWSDILTFDVTPVVEDSEMMEVIS